MWVRSRCESVAELKLQLKGSALGLMRGRIDAVELSAKQACYQSIRLHHVDLRSGPIQVDLKVLKPGQMLDLKHPFQVKGEVTLHGADLNTALLSPLWRWLGDWLAEKLMGLTPLNRIWIDNDVIELQAVVLGHRDPFGQRFRLKAEQGSVRFVPVTEGGATVVLPMDPAIRINDVQLGSGQLHLHGTADVTI